MFKHESAADLTHVVRLALVPADVEALAALAGEACGGV